MQKSTSKKSTYTTILAIDPGTKFCGLAVCKNNIPFPLKTITFNNNFPLLQRELVKVINDTMPDLIILGLPKHIKMKLIVEQYYIPIFNKTNIPDSTPILLIDETTTTTLATTYTHPTFHKNSLDSRQHKINGTYSHQKKHKQHGIIDEASAIILLYKAHEKNIIKCN